MNRTVLAVFLSLLLLSACAPEPPLSPQSPAGSAPSKSNQEALQPIGQNAAVDAYNAILSSFNAPLPHEPGYPGYPEEFADAYLEGGFLHVCLTDGSDEMQEKYRALVDTPNSIQFHIVEHSYNDLYALYMSAANVEGLQFTDMGIDVINNRVNIGIPDLRLEDEARSMILDQLPPEVSALFDEPPFFFEKGEYASIY